MISILPRYYPKNIFYFLKKQGIHPILAKLYASRGIKKLEDINLSLKELLCPSTLYNISNIVYVLTHAIITHKRLLVIADYDCDGATACAVAVRGLRILGATVDYLVPNRFEFGYGLTNEIVKLAMYKHPDILLTVDNGISSIEGVAAAQSLGIDVLITDHHIPTNIKLPAARVIVNPNQPSCKFASKHLSGVGVIFYVLIALRNYMNKIGMLNIAQKISQQFNELLGLVALGTVSDMVPLDKNNRILVSQGLKNIQKKQVCPGILALFKIAERNIYTANTNDLGFAIGPRLNAAGRLDDMSLGIECLLSDNYEQALEFATKLNEINNKRRSIEIDMHTKAIAQLKKITSDQTTIILFDNTWHQGIIGLIASRVKDCYNRPTIIFTSSKKDNNYIIGSARSICNFNIIDALKLISQKYPKLFTKFGGHAMAAGLTIKRTDLLLLIEVFEIIAKKIIDKYSLNNKIIETDGELTKDCFNINFINLLYNEVWGQGFPSPIFSQLCNVYTQTILKNRHLKLSLNISGHTLNAIWFGRTTFIPKYCYIVYKITKNFFKNKENVQLIIEHVQI